MAGGFGTRLFPFTKIINKSCLPVYDKPALYFQITALRSLGVTDIYINTCNELHVRTVLEEYVDTNSLQFVTEERPAGLVAALRAMASQIGAADTLFILGDIMPPKDIMLPPDQTHASIYVSTYYQSHRLSEYGVAELNGEGGIESFVEKPSEPVGTYAHTGITYYPASWVDYIDAVPSHIQATFTDLSNQYLKLQQLNAMVCHEPWFNMGTFEDVWQASSYYREHRHW